MVHDSTTKNYSYLKCSKYGGFILLEYVVYILHDTLLDPLGLHVYLCEVHDTLIVTKNRTWRWQICIKTCRPRQQLHLLKIMFCWQEYNKYYLRRIMRLWWIWDCHNSHYEQYCLLGCKSVYFGDSQTVWRNISPPSSGSKNEPSKKLAEADDKQNWTYSSALKMEGICFSKTLGYI
jgi:hypothetical protein